jgi:hypothetical protein
MNNPQYPDGKLNATDEGALQIAVFTEDGNVIINFGKPVNWVGMPPDQARALAALLVAQADAATH